ncbi:hypothetical protein [Saccharospirillum impatiens]|uniref:hypothetical protein n=1 Tax=Saccharospirillum impatiens TaxID=169438 RepID=UPI00048F1955|nr:hypothetical protein [Saccharospirillum impatiens]
MVGINMMQPKRFIPQGHWDVAAWQVLVYSVVLRFGVLVQRADLLQGLALPDVGFAVAVF